MKSLPFLLMLVPLAGAVHAQEPGFARFAALMRDPLLRESAQPYRLKQGREARVLPNGAFEANALWEEKSAPGRYVEEQRRGADFFIQPGLAVDDAESVARGITILQYGFDWMGEDGSFAGLRDAFHSASFFLEGASRAGLLLRLDGSPAFREPLVAWKPKVTVLARWFLQPSQVNDSRVKADLMTFTHRHYLAAAALAEAATFAEVPEAKAAAARQAEEGIARQFPDGTNPERGGFDAAYQTVGLGLAEQYWYLCDDPALRLRLRDMLVAGLKPLVARLDDDGRITVVDSTRVGKEKDRAGVTKSYNYALLVSVLVVADDITQSEHYRPLAKRVAERAIMPELGRAQSGSRAKAPE